MSYDITKHGDFKRYYDTTQKRNYWVLGYFGSVINISAAMDAAKQYAEANNVPLDTICIDEITQSKRYKYFRYIYSSLQQEQALGATALDNVFKWLTD